MTWRFVLNHLHLLVYRVSCGRIASLVTRRSVEERALAWQPIK
jgi:hypothetical protein